MTTVSEDELDDFFRRREAVRLPSESVPPPSKRRKGSHRSCSDASEDDNEDDASDASSELEVVGGPSGKKKATVKGKNRAQATITAGRRGKAPLAAPRPRERNKKATKLLSVDSSSPESSPERRRVRSATQMLEGGDALEAMARQLGGWKGEARPPRVKAAIAGRSTSESPETARTSRRQTSSSTGATSLSDKSSSAVKAKAKATASPRTTKKASATKRKAREPSSSPPIELEPEHVEQPAPPESFWGVKEAPPGQSATKPKRIHGEASKRLQEMSKLPALRPPDDNGDDIASTESTEEEDAPPKKYETVAAKAKRERQEALAAQKAKREAKAAKATATAAPPPKPAPNTVAAQPNILASFRKRPCPVCNSAILAAELEEHIQQCIAAYDTQQTQQQLDVDAPPPVPKPQPKPPPLPPPLPNKAPPAPRSPFSPKRPITNRASSHDGYIESSQAQIIEQDQEKSLAEELFPPSPSPKRISAAAKGKGRAVVQEEFEQEEDYDMQDGDENWPHEDEHYEGEAGADEDFDYEDGDGGEVWEDPADFAKLHGTTREVIEIGSDDDETVQVAARARMGGGGAVNTSRVKGPPKDGSPPPTGSIYISTLPHAMRLGYAQMYRERSPKRGAPDRTDPLAPQKMTAAPKAGFRGKGRRGGWGRGRGRGARRGARGRK